MKMAPPGTGAHLKALRTSSRVPQPLVAALVGSSTVYLAKVEDGLISPNRAYVGRVTEAIFRLMSDPIKPCPVLGCDSTGHVDELGSVPLAAEGSPHAHHADQLVGERWEIHVQRYDGVDLEWVVYAKVDDEWAMTPANFLAFSDAYKQASAYAAVLNGRPAEVTP